ncbi:Cytochrome c554 and c-prime [Neorhodopirellula lusitana]|uniref:Cytochrome c554 and c-prime n=1 Tax=Neorhodopirellula lusitana TaxID=445327 RepID=A0ABY1QCQ1_9BACT|nr:multiheme c-type cytochrome [Neorhodopirellula lusitana]SMP66978.1 Cytochrome c554 and c-prime [Neorhodopirellula lusitana]
MPKNLANLSTSAFSVRIAVTAIVITFLAAWAVLRAGTDSATQPAPSTVTQSRASIAANPALTASPSAPPQRGIEERLPPRARQSVDAWRQFVSAKFAGDHSCAECHEAEYAAHQRSGHSRTLTLMHQSPLADKLAEQGSYQDSRRDQTFQFKTTPNHSSNVSPKQASDQPSEAFLVSEAAHAAGVVVPVTWLLGSGIHAQTPIAVDEITQSGVELRWSAFAGQEDIGITPDHERFDDFQAGTIECFGRPLDASDIRACLGCHSTLAAPPSLPIMQSLVIENVGCERCHGPRKDHVTLAKQGLAEQAKPLLKYETAEAYMDACATCHRDESSVQADATPSELARFQPYGIKRSRCYLETPGNLTCSTCHDPHDTVSHDRSRSIAQCKQCHGGTEDGPSTKHVGPIPIDSQTVCPDQPSGDCIECHMPAVSWTAGISFHDHWIRVQ